MNKTVLILATITAFAPCVPLTSNAAPQVYDLKADWSDTRNPNGAWSYREGNNLMINNPISWVGGSYPSLAPGAGYPEDVGPAITKTLVLPSFFEPGDVSVAAGISGANILWTAPVSGTIDVSGALWQADGYTTCSPGSVECRTLWTLSHNGSALSSGVLECYVCTVPNDRNSPYDVALGSGGAAALQHIPVAAGDQVVLGFSGLQIGLNFTITLTPDSSGCPNASFAEDAIIWHQPLARNGASEDTDPSAGRTVKYRFKRGSTIPIQIHALGCTADVTSNASVIGKVTVFGDSNCDGAVDGNDAPIEFNGVGGGGGVMDKIDGHLKYNLDTKSLPTTTQCYILRVAVTDTSTGQEKFEEVLLQAK